MQRVLAWLAVVLAIVGGVGGVIYWRLRAAEASKEIDYKTAAVERRRVVGRVTTSGALQAVVTVQVGSQVSGRVQSLFADFNSTVKKGQLVAKLDPELFQAAVAQATASTSSARAGLAQAKAKAFDAERQYKRSRELKKSGLATDVEVETAETTLAVARSQIDVAKAAVEQASAQLHQATVNLSYTDIRSPIDGVVISRSVDVGQTVAASLQAPVIFTIAEDLRKMQVNTNVSEGDVGRLEPGMKASFTVDAFPGRRFLGKIAQIRNAAQTLQNVVTYNAVLDVENDDLKLRPGMTANVSIVYAEREDVLTVPNQALRFRPPSSPDASASAGSGRRRRGPDGAADAAPEQRNVWILVDGKPEPVAIRTGLSDGTVTEIIEGLEEGAFVLTDATSRGDAAVTAQSPGAPGAPRARGPF